jgi:hypothetical protein
MSGSPDPDPPPSAWRGLAAVLSALFFFLLASFPAPAGAEDFTIRSFRTAIEVRGDASLRIVETIGAEFHRPRHGLYRDIPFRYTDELGKKTVTPIRIFSVTDPSGNAWKYTTERTGGFVRVRIGDPDRFVTGRQVYVITYDAENGVLFFPDHDELYWNVTGNDWPAPIESAVATATVAGKGGSLNIEARCYTGPRGSREDACSVSPLPDGAAFVSTREFRAGEGMTIVLGWEKGVVRPPSAWKTALFGLDLSRNWVFAAPLAALLYMCILWYRKGKDPATNDPLVVAYAPPDEDGRPFLPAEIGALLDEKLDPRDITASVVNLAVKQYLTIVEKKTPGLIFDKTDYALRKEKEPGTELPPFERLLMERIFRDQASEVGVSDLKLTFYKNLDDLRDAAFDGLERMKCFSASPSSVKSRYLRAGGVILLGGGAVGWLGKQFLGDAISPAAIAVALSGLAVMLFSPIMPVKTLKGVKVLGRIKGFEEFLLRAEKDRLERMNDKNLFEKFLPYAIALDVSDRWAKAFEGIYQEPPRWYSSHGGIDTFRPSHFQRSLGSALSTLSGAMYSSPRSSGSGFSGGGSSGGGGGGGGGGSW